MSKKIQIAPSLLAADFSKLGEEIQKLESAGADLFHLDIMDGHFVPNITFGAPIIKKIRPLTNLPFDAHLMISNADEFIDEFHEAGCNWLSVHIEACPHIHRTLDRIRQKGMKAGVAINPGTSLFSLEGVIPHLDYVLIMSVNPGFGGQKFIPNALERVREVKKNLDKNILIEIDGGIKDSNFKEVVDAGADVIVMGTGLLEAPDYKKQIQKLKA